MTGLLAARLARRAGPPGLVDSAAVQAEVARKLGFLGLLSPLLQRLLARAAGEEAGGLAGGALPLAAPFAFGGGDPVATPLAAPAALQAPPQSPPLLADGAVRHLVRVSRRGRLADIAHENKPTDGGSPPPRPSPVATGKGETLFSGRVGAGTELTSFSPMVVRPRAVVNSPENDAALTSAAAPRRIAETRGGEQPADRDAALPLGGSPAPATGTIGSPDRSPNQGSPAVSHTTRLPEVAGQRPSAPAAPSAAAVGALPRAPELRVPGAGRRAETARVLAPEAASLPWARANEAQTALTILVSELPQPAAPRRPEIAVSEVLMARATVVPELRARPRPWAPLVLPAPLAEARRRAAGSRRLAPLAAEPASPDRTPIAPNPAATMASRPAAPAAAVALAGAELERLADKVSRMIARRVAVERERRGR